MNKILPIALLGCCAGLAFAEEPQGVGPPPANRAIDRFPQLDADSDGRLSRAEVADDAMLREQFGALDSDRNGFLDRDEFPRINAAPARDLDLDSDRVLPSREPAFPVWQFKPLIQC